MHPVRFTGGVGEVDRHTVAGLDLREVPELGWWAQPADLRQEGRRRVPVARPHDQMIELGLHAPSIQHRRRGVTRGRGSLVCGGEWSSGRVPHTGGGVNEPQRFDEVVALVDRDCRGRVRRVVPRVDVCRRQRPRWPGAVGGDDRTGHVREQVGQPSEPRPRWWPCPQWRGTGSWAGSTNDSRSGPRRSRRRSCSAQASRW